MRNRFRRRMIAVLSTLVLSAFALAACGDVGDQTGATPTQTTATTAEPRESTSPSKSPTESDDPTTQPSSSTATPPFAVGTFTEDELTSAGYETAGCWFSRPEDQKEWLLYGGSKRTDMSPGGYLKINGQPIALTPAAEADVVNGEPVTAYTSDDYDLELTNLGESTWTSMESNERDAVLVVTSQNGDKVRISGDLWCGV